ncbi:MAG: hypothetical protein ACI3T9_00910 [Romboutsia timonensis]
MAKSKLKEVNVDQLGIEEIEEINNFPDIPTEEVPLPEEPSVEEQIKMATQELEQKNNDLIQQIYYKEQECKQLRDVIDKQAQSFNECVGNLIYTVFGPKQ